MVNALFKKWIEQFAQMEHLLNDEVKLEVVLVNKPNDKGAQYWC